MTSLRTFKACQKGATAIEYGLVAALVSLAALVAIQSFASVSVGLWDKVEESSPKPAAD